MTSDFAPEVAKYPKSSPKLQNSVWAYCLAPLVMQPVYNAIKADDIQEALQMQRDHATSVQNLKSVAKVVP